MKIWGRARGGVDGRLGGAVLGFPGAGCRSGGVRGELGALGRDVERADLERPGEVGGHGQAHGPEAEGGDDGTAGGDRCGDAGEADLELVDRHVDGVSAGKAVGGKAAIFGDDPNTAQFFASSCHTLSKSDICQQ